MSDKGAQTNLLRSIMLASAIFFLLLSFFVYFLSASVAEITGFDVHKIKIISTALSFIGLTDLTVSLFIFKGKNRI